VSVFSLDRAGVEAAVHKLVETRYAPDPRILAVALFGSFARGDAVPGSDVDLLVLLDRDERRAHERIPDLLPGGFPVGIDILPWTRPEFEDRLSRRERLVMLILKEGRILLDRCGILRTAREAM
jgi:predicted nucleotidyltransferase